LAYKEKRITRKDPRDAMLARVFARATCLSVCPSVCPSVTRRYCISGVTMGWLLRLVTGGPTGKGAPTVPEFLMINF